MIIKSNFQMLREFKFEPRQFGILSGEEVKKIRDYFQIEERSNVDLQNLRDFVVLFYDLKKEKSMGAYDVMSGIVGMIDEEKWKRGMEV